MNYWEKRQKKRVNQANKTVSKVDKQLEGLFIESSEAITKDINNLIVKYMSETGLNYSDAVKKLTGKEMKAWRYSIQGYLNQIKKFKTIQPEKAAQLKLELETLAHRSRISRLDMLNTQIKMTLANKTEKEVQKIEKGLKTVYNNTYESIESDFSTDGAVVNARLSTKAINEAISTPWSGSDFSSTLWGEKRERLASTIKNEITKAMIQGVNPDKLTKTITEKMDANRKDIRRLVVTELNYANNNAELMSYKKHGVEKYKFVAYLDSKTSQVCRDLDGKIFNTSDAVVGVNYPPMHPNCRSTTVVVENDDWIDRLTPENNPDTNPEFFGAPEIGLTETKNNKAFSEKLMLAQKNNKHGEYVDAQSANDVKDYKKFVSDDGLATVAIKPDGDITCVVKNDKSQYKNVVTSLIITARENGGTKMDCYGKDLVNKYAKCGFEPVARVKFNPEYAQGKKVLLENKPDVYFMMKTEATKDKIIKDLKDYKYKQFNQDELEKLPVFEYDDAYAYRDKLLKGKK